MIKIKDLEFAYKKQPLLFNQLSLELNEGSILGLLGKNGVGKTTLLKLILGLRFPNAGTLKVLQHLPRRRDPSFLEQVFFVPEEFYLPPIGIKDFIKAHSGFYPRFDHQLIGSLLPSFDLSLGDHLSKLSYGQKKKFLISFALATKCRLLLMDEPTNGLDIPSKAVFRKVVAGALNEDQLIIIATHQVRDVETLIDHLVILDHGKVLVQKQMQEISAQLQFTSGPSFQEEEILYSEPILGGYKAITTQSDGDSLVDIELLFNAVTSGKQIFETHENN
ncbi:MAG: ABC transporter ATP-binding protein [Cyclobacteriaceae bacterium]